MNSWEDFSNYKVKKKKVLIDNGFIFRKSFAIAPRIIKVSYPREGFRMFYSEKGALHREKLQWIITSAFSSDGQKWVREKKVRIGRVEQYGEGSVTSPEILRMDDGRLKMYFEARKSSAHDAVIMKAISADEGLSWDVEPKPVVDLLSQNIGCGTPGVINLVKNEERLYFHAITESYYNIQSALIVNDETFIEQGIRIIQESDKESYGVYAPQVFKFNSGAFGMFYSAWANEPRRQGRIYFAHSQDGLNWTKNSQPTIESSEKFDEKHCSEPYFFPIEGRPYLFYEACNFQGDWSIISAELTP